LFIRSIRIIPSLLGIGIFAACSSAKDTFDYHTATAEAQDAYLQSEAQIISALLADRAFTMGIRVQSIKAEPGLSRILIKMECTYGGHMDCARPNNYTQVEEKRIKTLCDLRKRTSLAEYDLSIKWTEHAKGGATVMSANADNEICRALKT